MKNAVIHTFFGFSFREIKEVFGEDYSCENRPDDEIETYATTLSRERKIENELVRVKKMKRM